MLPCCRCADDRATMVCWCTRTGGTSSTHCTGTMSFFLDSASLLASAFVANALRFVSRTIRARPLIHKIVKTLDRGKTKVRSPYSSSKPVGSLCRMYYHTVVAITAWGQLGGRLQASQLVVHPLAPGIFRMYSMPYKQVVTLSTMFWMECNQTLQQLPAQPCLRLCYRHGMPGLRVSPD